MASCSGLPICLSGIQIFPQRHRPMLRPTRSRVQSRPPMPPTAPVCLPDAESAGSECESTSPSTMPATGLMRDNGGSHEGSSSEIFTNTSDWPRLALAQQMADLDCRREAVRRRSLQNSSYLMDYRLSSRQNDMMSACLQSQSKEEDESPCTPRSACAKAA